MVTKSSAPKATAKPAPTPAAKPANPFTAEYAAAIFEKRRAASTSRG